jgi:predicted dienelactone hydrolase
MLVKVILLAFFCGIVGTVSVRAAYDPLWIGALKIASTLLDLPKPGSSDDLPLKIYFPPKSTAAPVIIFSHGLGGSRENNPYLGEHWAQRGYMVIFLQHHGSDESLWKSKGPLAALISMKRGASAENLVTRVEEVKLLFDALPKLNEDAKSPCYHRMDLKHIGMSGHSFGAITTQVLAGEALAGGRKQMKDSRISAALMMSPSPPAWGDAKTAFSPISLPCLLMTGTEDDSPIGNISSGSRLEVFPALVNAPAWQVVFEGADHMSFGQRSAGQGNKFHASILAISTAYWDATLKGDPQAKAWLKKPAVLGVKDQWDRNTRAEKL